MLDLVCSTDEGGFLVVHFVVRSEFLYLFGWSKQYRAWFKRGAVSIASVVETVKMADNLSLKISTSLEQLHLYYN